MTALVLSELAAGLYIEVWPETPVQYLAQLKRYRRHKNTHHRLELFTYGLPTADVLVNTVLSADDQLAAASALCTKMQNCWD